MHVARWSIAALLAILGTGCESEPNDGSDQRNGGRGTLATGGATGGVAMEMARGGTAGSGGAGESGTSGVVTTATGGTSGVVTTATGGASGVVTTATGGASGSGAAGAASAGKAGAPASGGGEGGGFAGQSGESAGAGRAPRQGGREVIPIEETKALKATIHDVSLSGDYCSDGSVATAITPDQAAFTLIFATVIGDDVLTSSCQIAIEMDLPEGFELGNPRLTFRGSTEGAAALKRHYTFEGSGPARELGGPLDPGDFEFTDWVEGLWSGSCGETRRVRLVLTIEPSVETGVLLPQRRFQLYSLDFETSWQLGADWRRCGQTEPLEVQPGQQGEICGGPHARSCAPEFGCEDDGLASPGSQGTCVDLSEKVGPRAEDQSCGGPRSIECQSGLLCWAASQDAIDHRRLGRCVTPLAGAGRTCLRGIPSVACENGLHCLLEGNICVAADGELGSRCGQGLPDCRTDLYCNGTQCSVPRGKS